jgi:hypothetical protein
VQYPEKSAHPSTVGSRKQRKWPAEKANGKSERIRRGRKVRNRIKSRAGKRQGEEAAEVKSPRGVRRIVSGSRRLGTSGGYRQYIFAVQRAGYSICFESPPLPPTHPRALEQSQFFRRSRAPLGSTRACENGLSRAPPLPPPAAQHSQRMILRFATRTVSLLVCLTLLYFTFSLLYVFCSLGTPIIIDYVNALDNCERRSREHF